MQFATLLAAFRGLFLYPAKFRDGTMEFLLARPVSRREMFNTLALVEGFPAVLIAILPLFSAMLYSYWFFSSPPFYRLVVINFAVAAMVAAIFLLGALLGLYAGMGSSRSSRALRAFLISALVAAMISLNPAGQASWLFKSYLWLTLLACSALCCLFYYLGRRRLEKMDI
ncbi:MAG: hypothetical protein ACYC0Q_13705 [Eubacteriales bacterium]